MRFRFFELFDLLSYHRYPDARRHKRTLAFHQARDWRHRSWDQPGM